MKVHWYKDEQVTLNAEQTACTHTHPLIDNKEASCILVHHSWEDGLRGRSSLPYTPEVEGCGDELLHLAVILGPYLLQTWTVLQLLVPGEWRWKEKMKVSQIGAVK